MKNKYMVGEILSKFFFERNSSNNTKQGYVTALTHFEKMTGKNIDEMMTIAKNEKKMEWEDTQLYTWLIAFRNYCYNNFKEESAKKYVGNIRTLFRHNRIVIGELPYFSTKQVRKAEVIDYEDLPNREMLKKAIEVKNPLLKAMTLFMSSSGISRTDCWNLTVQDYLDSTFEYHQTNNIYDAIKKMNDSELSVIPTFKLKRVKTGETYRTFASHESVRAINNYLLSRELLENTDRLFDIDFRYLNDLFKQTNDLLGFGEIDGRSRFCPQMLRSYQASQLAEAGMNDSLIDLIQGRKPPGIARRHYIRVKRETLKEEYIRCLPFLVVDDIEEVRTELEIVKEENKELRTKQEQLDDIIARLDKLEQED